MELNSNIGEYNARQMMSEAKFYESYSRYNEELDRYETWREAVSRVMNMHREKYRDFLNEELETLINFSQESYNEQEVLGAQRILQYGGEQLLKHQIRAYNCAATYCDRPEYFGEYMYALLCGTGVGTSVQRHHIEKLPYLIEKKGTKGKTFIIQDSIEGWADAIDVLTCSFFNTGGKFPEYRGCHISFDFSEIRPKGAYISGGFKAPGPEPLMKALSLIESLLIDRYKKYNKLRPIDAYDLCMYAADAVVSGGVRRSANLILFSKDDKEMLTAKTGNWFEENPQRARSNNSAVLERSTTTKEEFDSFIENIKQYGEPGIVFTSNKEFLFNPLSVAA